MRIVPRLVPLLLVYVIAVGVYGVDRDQLRVDERRYAQFAENLTEGYYSPSDPHKLGLWNGPGYPLILTPIVGLSLPWAVARFLNIALMLLAFMYLYRLLRLYLPRSSSLIAVYVVGLLPVVIRHVPRLLTEPLSMLLVGGFAYHFCKAYGRGTKRRLHLILAGAFLGYVALTKVLFGYVIAGAIIIFLLAFLITRRRNFAKSLLVGCIAMLVCVPYLAYTHSITGKYFYWGNSGGLSLYWMSTPFDGEYGNWLAPIKPWIELKERNRNHHEFIIEMAKRDPLERDELLKKAALENIKNHPDKYVRNWLANIARLFCNFPFAYRTHALFDLWFIVPGTLLASLLVLTIPTAWARRREIPYEIGALALIAFLYIGGSSLLSAFNRMLLPVFPILAVWICFVLTNTYRNLVVCSR